MSFGRSVVVAMLLVVPAFGGTNNTIVISAPRLEDLDLMDVAVAADVTVIEREAIEQSGAAAIPQLLEQEANVLVRGQGGNANDGQLSMRGFGDNSHLRVLVLVDGHKNNRPDMGRMEWQNLPVSNIEKIEVIRGGQNVLYGNHALSGVIKITTRKGEDDGLQLSGSMGSYGYLSGSASYGGVAGDAFYHVGISDSRYEGFRTNSATASTTFNGSLGWYLNDTDTLTLRGMVGESRVEFPGSLTYDEMQRDPTQSSTPNEQSEDRSGQATLLYETERGWGAARMNAGINYRDRVSTLGQGNVENDQLGLSLAPRVRFGEEDQFLMLGIDLLQDNLDIENYLFDIPSIQKSWAELERFTAAPYLFARRTFRESTVLSGGVRYEYAGTDNRKVEYVDNQLRPTLQTNRGQIPNPNYKNPPDADPDLSFDEFVKKDGWAAELTVSQPLSDQHEVFAGYDRVYRYPTLDEVAAYQGYPLGIPVNDDLEPERGNNFEVGTRFKNREWSASLTGFFMALENEISFDDVQNINRNIGATRRMGLEPELAWSRSSYGASTRWTFVDARFDGGENSGNKVPLVPWATGVTTVWFELYEGMRLAFVYTLVSEQYQGNDEENRFEKMDPYGLLGFRFNFAVTDYADVLFSVHNLLDETYAYSAYSGGYYPGSGRSFRIGLNLVF